MSQSQPPVFLYVEDDPLSREIMQMMLSGLGYSQLMLFEDSRDFVARVEALPTMPDVIFLDVHVQPSDGFEVLEMLRSHARFASRLVIAVTASVMSEEIARLKEAGFDGTIGKPLDFENFAPLIEQLLAGKEVWHIV